MGVLEKVLPALRKPVQTEQGDIKLPDNGGSTLPAQDFNNSVILPADEPCIVEFTVFRNIRESVYNQAVITLKACKQTEIDTEILLPQALEVGYEYKAEKYKLTARFKDIRDLQGGLIIGLDQAGSWREMSRLEVEETTKFIEPGEDQNAVASEVSGMELVPFAKISKMLENNEYTVINCKRRPGEGLKALVLIKEKKEETSKLEQPQSQPVSVNYILGGNFSYEDKRN